MKHLSLVLGLIVLAGCQWQNITSVTNPEPATYWVNYYPTQCNDAPWGDTLAEKVIIDYYSTIIGVTVHSVEVTPPAADFFTCSACGCPIGVQVSVQTDAAGKETLMEHGFVEEELVSLNTQNEDNGIAENPPRLTELVEGEAGTEEDKIAEDAEEDAENAEVELTEADQELKDRVGLVQSALQDYYTQYGSYPDSLEDLTVKLDTTSMTYTPIGVTPADYYDLSVEYSTGREVLNP